MLFQNYFGMVPSSTTISFACPICQTQLSVPVSMAGVTGPCPTCQNQLTAPQFKASPSQASAVPQPQQAAPPAAAPVRQSSPAQVVPPQAASPLSVPPLAQQLPPLAQQLPSLVQQPLVQQATTAQAIPPLEPPMSTPPAQAMPAPRQPVGLKETGSDPNVASSTPLPVSPLGGKPAPETKLLKGHSSRRNSRERRSVTQKKSKPSLGKLIGILAVVGLIAGGAFALPKIKEILQSSQIDVPETASINADPPAKQDGNPTDPKVDVEPLPLAPANGHLANNTAPRLIDEPELDPIEEDPAFADIEGILDEPKGFLESYLKAPSWEMLVEKSLQGDALRAKMAAYYKVRPYAPEEVSEITFQHKQKLPNSNYQFYLFKVITDTNKGSFPMTVEETSTGFQTDWEAYVQFKDAHLETFLSNPEVGPDGKGQIKTFNVILRRAHDFTDDVPGSDEKWCYKIDAPVDELNGGFSFIPKFSTYGQELDTQLKWLLLYFPIVDVRWEMDANHPGSKPYVRLMKIRQFNWRGHGEKESELEGLTANSEG